ncbi:MAG: lytic transglycosylase domain-containing protein [Syntrophomonadaceae bacterium]
MKHNIRKRLSILMWVSILLFLVVVLTFPKWISIFYPQPHSDLVFTAAQEYGVDPYLVFAIIRAESKYQNAAQSPVGARGLMQIMPETAQWISEIQGISDFSSESLHDPEINIRFGCWYLNNLSQEFDGRTPMIVAAYNAGRGKVREWVLNGKWDGSRQSIDQIPFEETRLYVKNVLNNYEAYNAIYQ